MPLENVIDTATLIFAYASAALFVTLILLAYPVIWQSIAFFVLLYAPFVVATGIIYAAYVLFGWIGAIIAAVPVTSAMVFGLVKLVKGAC
jgi:hypothetical protein